MPHRARKPMLRQTHNSVSRKHLSLDSVPQIKIVGGWTRADEFNRIEEQAELSKSKKRASNAWIQCQKFNGHPAEDMGSRQVKAWLSAAAD
mmetsp:Transcript_9930/g.17521  ORF Transcript_9930/g.17521 Transcript_9930/m.17521 type:complete len:91 (+) Transcript_9930:448-720(+)